MLAAIVTATMLGQAGLAILVAFVGFLLNRRSKQIHVLVNSQMTDALKRIVLLERRLGLTPGEAIPPPDTPDLT